MQYFPIPCIYYIKSKRRMIKPIYIIKTYNLNLTSVGKNRKERESFKEMSPKKRRTPAN